MSSSTGGRRCKAVDNNGAGCIIDASDGSDYCDYHAQLACLIPHRAESSRLITLNHHERWALLALDAIENDFEPFMGASKSDSHFRNNLQIRNRITGSHFISWMAFNGIRYLGCLQHLEWKGAVEPNPDWSKDKAPVSMIPMPIVRSLVNEYESKDRRMGYQTSEILNDWLMMHDWIYGYDQNGYIRINKHYDKYSCGYWRLTDLGKSRVHGLRSLRSGYPHYNQLNNRIDHSISDTDFFIPPDVYEGFSPWVSTACPYCGHSNIVSPRKNDYKMPCGKCGRGVEYRWGLLFPETAKRDELGRPCLVGYSRFSMQTNDSAILYVSTGSSWDAINMTNRHRSSKDTEKIVSSFNV